MKKALSVLVVLFVSFQLNAQWIQTNGPNGGKVNCLTMIGTNIIAGTDSGGIYLSTNDGTNWTKINNGLTKTKVNAITVSGANIIAGTDSGAYLSTNSGNNWTQADNGLTDSTRAVYSFAEDGTNIFEGSGHGVFLSSDNGNNWTPLNGLGGYISTLSVSGANIYAGENAGGVYYSSNNGTNWKNIFPFSDPVSSIVVAGTNVIVGTKFGGVYLSPNNGNNWGHIITNTSDNVLVINGTNIFAGTDSGVFLSENNGLNWSEVNDGLSNKNISSLNINGTTIFAGTSGAGVWRRPISELTGVSNEVKVLPQEYTLFQNYPNPFNPSTVIKYAVPFESSVDIRFYNSLGQIVQEVNEGNKQPGNYEINFNSSGLASGIYFYSIIAVPINGKNDFRAVKKMILLK